MCCAGTAQGAHRQAQGQAGGAGHRGQLVDTHRDTHSTAARRGDTGRQGAAGGARSGLYAQIITCGTSTQIVAKIAGKSSKSAAFFRTPRSSRLNTRFWEYLPSHAHSLPRTLPALQIPAHHNPCSRTSEHSYPRKSSGIPTPA